MQFITYKNNRLAFSTEGKGETVVLLHGFCEDSSIWNEFKTELLEKKYRVICIDLPGFGQSDMLKNNSIEAMADWVEAVVSHLKVDKLVLIGHSMGGYVGLSYAEKYPGKLFGLALFHSHPYQDSEEKKEDRNKGMAFIRRHGHVLFVKQLISKLFAPGFPKSNTFLVDRLLHSASKYSSEAILAALLAMRERPDQSGVLESIQCPVLFIIGEKDQAISFDTSMEQTHLPLTASIHILEKVGHMGMFEAKKKTQQIVRNFLEYAVRQREQR